MLTMDGADVNHLQRSTGWRRTIQQHYTYRS